MARIVEAADFYLIRSVDDAYGTAPVAVLSCFDNGTHVVIERDHPDDTLEDMLALARRVKSQRRGKRSLDSQHRRPDDC